jgi:DNA-binding NarL/FixJ family response regulator
MKPQPQINVVVADDHPMVQEALVQAVNAMPGFTVCGQADSSARLRQVMQSTPADCLVLDICMQGEFMLDLIPDLLKARPDLKILVVSAFDDELNMFHAIRSGARGFVSKIAMTAEFEKALRAVQAGEHYLPAGMKAHITERLLSKHAGKGGSLQDKLFALTAKETEVFRLLGEWKSTAEIAELLKISPKTVAIHRIHIKEKLGCPSLPDLLHFAVTWVQKKVPLP